MYEKYCPNCRTELPLEEDEFGPGDFCYYCDEYEAPHSHWSRGYCLECLRRHKEDLALAVQQDIEAGVYKPRPEKVEIPFELFERAQRDFEQEP
jgi:hypothetical protein